MGSKVAMADGYAHKTTGMKLEDQTGAYEEVLVSRSTVHPELGRCLVGSFISGIGMFNVHFPVGTIRPATEEEIDQLTKRRYVGCGADWKLGSEDFATEEDLKDLPEAQWDSL